MALDYVHVSVKMSDRSMLSMQGRGKAGCDHAYEVVRMRICMKSKGQVTLKFLPPTPTNRASLSPLTSYALVSKQRRNYLLIMSL